LDTAHINLENIIAAKQHDGKQSIHKLYVDREGEVKFYYQLTTPAYGDFTKGNIYVSVHDVLQYDTDDKVVKKNHEAVKFESPDVIKNLMRK